jgi:putative tricarboxylic transport membrane protein
MKRWDLISSIVLLVFAVVTFLEATKMPFGSLTEPKPGFGPMILAIFLALFSLILLGQAVREKRGEKQPFFLKSKSWKRVVLAIGALLAYAFLYEFLGHKLTTFLLLVFFLRLIEPMKWWLVLVIAFFSSLAFYLVFGVLLSIPLPIGRLHI